MTCDRWNVSFICNSWYKKSALYLEVQWNKWASVYGEKNGQLNQKQENYSGMRQPQWNKDRIKEQFDESESVDWKSWLRGQHSENEDHGIRSHHFMGHRRGNSGNSMSFILGGSKITVDGDCTHEVKRRLLLGRKVMTNLDSMLESRDITLPTKVRLVKAFEHAI